MKKQNIQCPTCNKKNTWTKENVFRPFCSERCKLIDLGEWAAEKHSIPGQDNSAPIPDQDDENENL